MGIEPLYLGHFLQHHIIPLKCQIIYCPFSPAACPFPLKSTVISASSPFPCMFKRPRGSPHLLIKSRWRTVALETREPIQQRVWASSPCLDFGGRWSHSALLKGHSTWPAEKPVGTNYCFALVSGWWEMMLVPTRPPILHVQNRR